MFKWCWREESSDALMIHSDQRKTNALPVPGRGRTQRVKAAAENSNAMIGIQPSAEESAPKWRLALKSDRSTATTDQNVKIRN